MLFQVRRFTLCNHAAVAWGQLQRQSGQIGAEVVDEGRGDPAKSIKVKRILLEMLEAEVEAHRRVTPGPSQTICNSEGIEAHIHSLVHCENCVISSRRHWGESMKWA